MKRRQPTHRDEQTLEAISAFWATHQCSPTMREVSREAGLSFGTVQGCVKHLETLGSLRVIRVEGRVRVMEPAAAQEAA